MGKQKPRYNAKDEQKLMAELWAPHIRDNPYNFVMFAYPWGKPGTPLEHYSGPRTWQTEILLEIAEHINSNRGINIKTDNPKMFRMAVSSGRGIGKSALVAWLNHWHLSCHIGATAITTANSETQLKTRTWAELGKWKTLAINSHWFEITAMRFVPAEWFADLVKDQLQIDTTYYYSEAQLWSEEKPDAFAGVHNPKGVMLLFDEACHDDQTEVLTDSGWKYFKDLDGSERLMSMNPESKQCVYLKPISITKSPYKGKMHVYQQRGADFCVTPNHEMFYTSIPLNGQWLKKEIQNFNHTSSYMMNTLNWDGEYVPSFTISSIQTERKAYEKRIVNMDHWLYFLGFYLSDGSLVCRDGKFYTAKVSQKDESRIHKLKDILESFGYSPKIYKMAHCFDIQVHDSGLATFLSQYGRIKQERKIPRYVFGLSKVQIRIFLDAFRDADGYIKSKLCEVIYASNKDLADGVHELYLLLGLRVSITKRKLKGITNWILDHFATATKDGYVVSASHHKSLIKHVKKKEKIIDYDGMIYCATVPPHHLLFTRRNGYTLWSGNSGISENIWDVSSGFFTDRSYNHFHLAFSNPRRNSGAFYECFHKHRSQWRRKQIDSRTVEGLNAEELQNMIDKYGEDSYHAMVEVKGIFPSQGDRQFIPRDLVQSAVERDIIVDSHAGLIMGIDVARYGDDKSVFFFRQGRDARTIPSMKFSGKSNMEIANIAAEMINKYNPNAVCVDAGSGTGVIDRLRELGYKVNEVWFGSKSSVSQFRDKRAELWGEMKEWLRGGMLPSDPDLVDDLCAPEYDFDPRTESIFLEPKDKIKKRGLASPDIADAFACTFSVRVSRSGTYTSKGNKVRMADGVNYDVFTN